MSARSDYIVLIDAGQACICNQCGGVIFNFDDGLNTSF